MPAAVAVALAVGFANSAEAQLAKGYSGSSSLTYIDHAEAMMELTLFGRCYAKKNRDEALALLATEPGSPGERQTIKKLFRRNSLACMATATNLRMPIPYIRGVIAEGMLRFGAGIPASHALTALPAARVRNLSDAARCYTPAHKGEIGKLLATKAGSKEEHEAVSAMMGDFESCLPAKPTALYTTLIRYRLAEALLRLNPALAPSGGK